MARFRYLGEPAQPSLLKKAGATLAFRLPLKDGRNFEIKPPDPVKGFEVGQDLGLDVTDSRALRYLRVDPRFEEIKP